jgi:hypothetical protein
MTDHPITPPPELVREWGRDANLSGVPYNDEHWAYEQHIANRAAQWGADQELEACCEWLEDWVGNDSYAIPMRAARRPKPPSLKEQALELARPAGTEGAHVTFGPEELALIRRALESIND